MKRIIWLMLGSATLITSCKKLNDYSTEKISGIDSTGKELIVKYVELWSAADSFVTTYKYNINDLLMEENSLSGFGFTHFLRDNKGRVITTAELAANNDTVFTDVHYVDENSGTIAYTISHNKITGKITDSTVYEYTNGKISKTMFYTFPADTLFFGNFYTWAYDAKNNISQLVNYTRNNEGKYLYNIGYDFMYDDKPNPFYSNDQVRQCTKWYISSSPNNLVKQINHYGGPQSTQDDYIGLLYTYNTTGTPAAAKRSGPAIGTIIVQSLYYYK
jgi:hypothetical protein